MVVVAAANISHTTALTVGNSDVPAQPARPHDEARTPNEPFARIREISDEEVCPQCQCLLNRSENNKNKVGKARRGRCDDCFGSMPAPVADMGCPSNSSRDPDATTESTFTLFFLS